MASAAATPGDDGAVTLEGDGYNVSYEPQEGWAEGDHGPTIFEFTGPHGATMVITRILGTVPGQAEGGSLEVGPADTVDQVISYLNDHQALEVSEPKAVAIGGLSGQQVDVHVPGDEQVDEFLHQVEPNAGYLFSPPGAHDRGILLQHEVGVILVGIITADPEDSEAGFAAAEPLLTSLQFE